MIAYAGLSATENGTMLEKGNFQMGIRTGKWEYYSKEMNLIIPLVGYHPENKYVEMELVYIFTV